MTIICNTDTTLSAECPTGATITPDTDPFEVDDVLTCIADGYSPTYMWTGIVDGMNIASQTGSTYTLVEGDFDLTCSTTVEELTCTETDSVTGTVLGKCQIQHNSLLIKY